MTPISNGTHAHDVAMHFMAVTNMPITPYQVANVTKQADTLLQRYTKREIISTINHYVSYRKMHLYSFNFIVKSIDNGLAEMESLRIKDEARIAVEEMASSLETIREEVKFDVESSERNRAKANRFGVQSRIGEKYTLDMLKGQ